MRIGLRDANQQFSKAIKAVKSGEEVVLTERGKPIAVIKPYPETNSKTIAIRRLEAAGVLRPAARTSAMPDRPPIRIKGKPLSQTVDEGREDREFYEER